MSIAACGTDTSLLNSTSSVKEVAALAGTSSRTLLRTVSYRPPLGPPDEVNAELTRQLNDVATEEGLALITDTAFHADVALRGYVSAMRKGSTVNVTYLWDVLDARGQRVHRISGEEALAHGVDAKQPWDAMTPAVARMIALRTISEIARWARSTPLPNTITASGAASVGGMAPPIVRLGSDGAGR